MSTQSYIGELTPFLGNFVMREYLRCHGQVESINLYSSLFSILGTNYGGDGRITFATPELRGRSMVGRGLAPGFIYNYQLGMEYNVETHSLSYNHLPQHHHTASLQMPDQTSTVFSTLSVAQNNANQSVPSNNAHIAAPGYDNFFAQSPTSGAVTPVAIKGLSADVQSTSQANIRLNVTNNNTQSFDSRNPLQAVNVLINAEGLYPPRS